MKLSRSHALFLVGTLAAAACTVENADDDNNGGAGSGAKGGSAGSGTGGSAGKGTGGSATAGKGGTGGSSAAGTGGTGNVGADGGEAGYSANEGGAGGYSAEEGGAGGYSAEEGGMSSTAGGVGGEGGAGSICDDTQAAQLGCEDLATSSCDIKTFLDDECAMTWKNMKPSISNVARNCMLELSQDELCNDATKTYGCIDQALKDACPDETVSADCDTILAYGACSGKTDVTTETCSAYLSGLTANGRSEMVSCMEGYCDFYRCAEGLN